MGDPQSVPRRGHPRVRGERRRPRPPPRRPPCSGAAGEAADTAQRGGDGQGDVAGGVARERSLLLSGGRRFTLFIAHAVDL